ncbi:MAG TPA: hypothetical protein VH575_06450 [Gemmataceae bacterium]|jgi:hypothetical protein
MKRIFFAIAVLVVLPLASRAEETVIRLSVQPMAAPKPALRYLLLPELKEMTPGNPIPNYLKCLLDQDFSSERETLRKSALRQADRAARMDKPDWQVLLKLKTDGLGLLLPDVQKMRALAGALQARFREEIAQGRIDDALGTAKTMFALSRHLGEHPTLIGYLVAAAIAQITIAPLEELLEQPGCPNLYWALTNLPHPLISLEKSMEGERLLLQSEFHELDDREPMTADQINKAIAHIDKVRQLEGRARQSKEKTRAWLNARIQDEKRVEAARRRLSKYGIPTERLTRFPADQVILLDEKREYETRRDEAMKFMILPTWQVEKLAVRTKPSQEPALFASLVPFLEKVRQAQGRLEQRIALLRHVEALRMYAAKHEGQWPEKLSDIELPLPVDPFTGKPFVYKSEGETAHLRGTPPRSYKEIPSFNIHYEITIRK